MIRPPHSRVVLWAMTCLGALCLTFAVNCQLGPALRGKVAVQGWDSRLGPLVSHRTFPGDCGLCHVPDRWDVLRQDLVYDHEKETGVALEGAHREARCLRCHNDRGPVSAYVARGCGGCHPDPHASSLGLDCQRCHNQVSWRPQGLIAEHARTRFPLYGVHAVTPCESCHLQAPAGQYRGAPRNATCATKRTWPGLPHPTTRPAAGPPGANGAIRPRPGLARRSGTTSSR